MNSNTSVYTLMNSNTSVYTLMNSPSIRLAKGFSVGDDSSASFPSDSSTSSGAFKMSAFSSDSKDNACCSEAHSAQSSQPRYQPRQSKKRERMEQDEQAAAMDNKSLIRYLSKKYFLNFSKPPELNLPESTWVCEFQNEHKQPKSSTLCRSLRMREESGGGAVEGRSNGTATSF
ncbi:hypothetical protein NE237_004366 [Protea cynaroides]|uniref:Uncharacterized protein n=1 Tax=Protea cynaroides TaxID=273540 RepID=A0A9Q0KIQ4_9MAGN|nr:hypothetical protein NE237_004366 [Protea cynaroides]